MKYLQSADFKSGMLLDMFPGDQVSIQCRNWADSQSKSTACRNSFKAHEDEYREKGIGSLTVQKVGDAVVLVTLNAVSGQEEFTDTMLEEEVLQRVAENKAK